MDDPTRPPVSTSCSNDLLSAMFRNDTRFKGMLMKVKKWGGCAPLNSGKENDPTVLYAVEHGAITLGKERNGPLGIYTGQMCITLTDSGWELVGR